ncbi:MAG: hypothetical protein IPK19_25300 [Chloroflexi bacterium]|nr:hypothetical protein [Chloroflexota bacterium]
MLTESTVGAIDLTGADTVEAVQANMSLDELPDRVAVLDAVDAIRFPRCRHRTF